VDHIRAGNSNIRNPILVSHVAKGLLPYRGLGSGIKRALAEWPDIDLTDDQDGCLFTAAIRRPEKASLESTTRRKHPRLESGLESRLESWLESNAQVTAQVTAQVAAQVALFGQEPRPAREIMREIGLKNWKTFQANYLLPLLDAGLLERTIPNKPQSRLQKYRLTETGRRLLDDVGNGGSG
jgi:hypothetical protein